MTPGVLAIKAMYSFEKKEGDYTALPSSLTCGMSDFRTGMRPHFSNVSAEKRLPEVILEKTFPSSNEETVPSMHASGSKHRGEVCRIFPVGGKVGTQESSLR